MLSDSEVRRRIETGNIQLDYAFMPAADDSYAYQNPVKKASGKGPGRTLFNERLVRSRLALTLGPVVKPVSQVRWIAWGERFAGNGGIVDLRQCKKGWSLLPGQSVVVFTIERFVLPPDISALIVGRVSNYNNGLVVTTSYMDSGWQGLIKLHIINTSQKPVLLSLGMEIARVFFEETPGASLDVSAVAKQGVHYGSSWSHVFADGNDPFPQAASPRIRRIGLIISTVNDLLKRYSGIGILALIVSIALGAASTFAQVQRALDTADTVRTLEAQVGGMKASAAQHGVVTVEIPVGATSGFVDVVVDPATNPRVGQSSCWGYEIQSRGDVSFTCQPYNGKNGVSIKIAAKLTQPAQSSAIVLQVGWVYLP